MNKSATSKEVLLETAREIAYREGISKVSIRRLASETGVAIGTVYNYYPAKADLVADVMEDFWRNVFHGKHFDTESGDFLRSVEDIYERFSVNLTVFEREFLDDVSSMEKEERQKSRSIMDHYMVHMKAGLLRILMKDEKIGSTVWSEEFTPQMLIEFTFSNMGTALAEGKTDCGYLLAVLERILYRESRQNNLKSKKDMEE